MAKTKKFRVAVAGDTVDGRVLEEQQLREAAETFNATTYGVRVNVEHIRGLSGDKPFGIVGDVVGLSVQEDQFSIGGKTEKRLALYAEIQPNARGIELNKADQKVYSSIELLPNFAGSGKFGLIGLAVTDTPASIGTERLQFSKATQSIIGPTHEVELKFDEDKPSETQTLLTGAMTALTAAVTALTGGSKADPEKKPDPKPPVDDGADKFGGVLKAMTDVIAAQGKANNDAITKLTNLVEQQQREFSTLKTQLETEVPATFTPRQPISGGGNADNLSAF